MLRFANLPALGLVGLTSSAIRSCAAGSRLAQPVRGASAPTSVFSVVTPVTLRAGPVQAGDQPERDRVVADERRPIGIEVWSRPWPRGRRAPARRQTMTVTESAEPGRPPAPAIGSCLLAPPSDIRSSTLRPVWHSRASLQTLAERVQPAPRRGAGDARTEKADHRHRAAARAP